MNKRLPLNFKIHSYLFLVLIAISKLVFEFLNNFFLLLFCIEIRQEAVKAALAMYSNDKKSIILSSKRNTTYVTPSLMQNENPFPVNHIASGKF
jgi:hypothetical protein